MLCSRITKNFSLKITRNSSSFIDSRIKPNRLSREPRLAGKVCVVTGASRGIGQAIAVRFVEEGAKVVLVSNEDHKETLDLIAGIKDVSNLNDVAFAHKCDISNEQEILETFKATSKKFGDKVNVLVNNAALFIFHSVETATSQDWDKTASVNIKGNALFTKHALPFMKNAGSGSIIFLGSISSYKAQPNCATYAITKSALTQLSRSCAYDLAKYNIRCNALCPGSIETPISSKEREEHGWTYEEWKTIKTKNVMLQRIGDVRETANAALFLASDESSYCTGIDLFVDGGVMSCTTME